MKPRNQIASLVLGGLITTSPIVPAWAGDNINSDIRLTVSALPTCYADTNALTFDLGTDDKPNRPVDQTKEVKLHCEVPSKVTLQGTLRRGDLAQAGGAVPSLSGCTMAGVRQCFDLTQAGHTFDVPAAGADVGILVSYQTPSGLGIDTFTGLLTVTWP